MYQISNMIKSVNLSGVSLGVHQATAELLPIWQEVPPGNTYFFSLLLKFPRKNSTMLPIKTDVLHRGCKLSRTGDGGAAFICLGTGGESPLLKTFHYLMLVPCIVHRTIASHKS